MKRAMFSVLTVLVLVSLVGCARHRWTCGGHADGCCADGCCCANGQQGCQSCNDPNNCHDGCACDANRCRLSCRLFGHQCAAKPQPEVATAPVGAVAYPYYTVRGPRFPREESAQHRTVIGWSDPRIVVKSTQHGTAHRSRAMHRPKAPCQLSPHSGMDVRILANLFHGW